MVLLLSLVAVLVEFRVQASNGFTVLFGGFGDGVIAASIAEHWHNVFRGLARWNQTAYFYPVADTLGYNDGYFLIGVAASLFRFGGADPLLAFELALMTLRVAGFVAFYLLAGQVFSLRPGWALLGAAIVTVSNNLYIQSDHAQLLTVSLAPLLGWLLGRMLAAAKARADAATVAWGAGAGLLFGAWLLTAFYTAWFAALFAAIVFGVAFALGAVDRRTCVTIARWPLLLVLLLAALCLVPFLLAYLPKARETGMHGFAGALAYTPTMLDFVRLGPGNYLFGWLDLVLARLTGQQMVELGEHIVGFPPALALCAIGGAALAVFAPRGQLALWRVLAVATVVSAALCVRVGHFTLWRYVHAYVPGAGGIRVVARDVLFLTCPVVLLALNCLQRTAGGRPAWLVAPLAVLLLGEELTASHSVNLPRAAVMAELDAISPPPASCQAFYVHTPSTRLTTGLPELDPLYVHNVEAMMVAEVLDIPTVNGFSTFNPPGWNFADPQAPDYPTRVWNYLREYDVDTVVCGLDLSGHAWSVPLEPPALAMLPPDGTIDLSATGNAPGYLRQGWSSAESGGRWTERGTAAVSFALETNPHSADLAVELVATPYAPGLAPTAVQLVANGLVVARWNPVEGRQTLRGIIPSAAVAGGRVELRLLIATPRKPSDHGSADGRSIGLFVEQIHVAR